MEKYEEFVMYVVKALVDDEKSISLEKKDDDRGTLLTLKVAKEDMGKIIGFKGETADAIRKLLRGVAFKEDKKVSLVIKEPGEE